MSPPAANVAVRQRFWTLPSWTDSPTVPTPLVYADCVASDDPARPKQPYDSEALMKPLRRLD